jgi:Arc/MetJ-type ribon-helix-helix transcriptional regulator
MGARKQSVSFTDAAFAFAEELVRSGEYPTISAAVSGEMMRSRAARAAQQALLEAEVTRRLALPVDQWAPLGEPAELTRGARARLAALSGDNGA